MDRRTAQSRPANTSRPTAGAPTPRIAAAEAGLLFVVLVWGFNFAVMKDAFGVLPAFGFNAVRLTLSTTVCAGLAALACRRSGVSFLPRGHFRELLLLGLLGHGIYQALFVTGLSWTTSGNAALLLATAPVWTALYETVFAKARLPRAAWLGLGTALTGTVVLAVLGAKVEFGEDTLLGDLAVGLSAIAWGIYTARGRPLVQKLPPTLVLFWSLASALPFLWLLGARDVVTHAAALAEPKLLLAILWSGALATGIGYALWNRAILALGASATSSWNNLVPVVAVAVGVVWLDEPVGLPQVAGGGLVLAGVFWTRRALRR